MKTLIILLFAAAASITTCVAQTNATLQSTVVKQSITFRTNVVDTTLNPNLPLISGLRLQNDRDKWVTTTVERVETIEFTLNGQQKSVTTISGVSTNVVHLQSEPRWKEVK